MVKGSQRRAKNVQPDAQAPPLPNVPSPSPSLSDSSDAEDVENMSEMRPEGSHRFSASRPGSPVQVQGNPDRLQPEDSIRCQWEDCGIVFTHLPTLIDHINDEHVGVNKSNYTCEWTSCSRRGLAQGSRSALTGHIRKHTGEKPFLCSLPECVTSFARSDALAKHLRLKHNIEPPAPGRGGSRKRKRGADNHTQGTSTPNASLGVSPPSSIPNASGFSTFKVEPHTPSELTDELGGDSKHEYFSASRGKASANGRQRRLRPSQLQPQLTPSPETQGNEDEEGYTSSSSDVLPAHLQPHYDESTGLVLGRTPAKVMYLLMKAKQQYALEQHEALLEQLRATKGEMKKEKDEKESALDELFQHMLGPEAHILRTMPLPVPPEMDFAGPSSAPPPGHGFQAGVDPYTIPGLAQNASWGWGQFE